MSKVEQFYEAFTVESNCKEKATPNKSPLKKVEWRKNLKPLLEKHIKITTSPYPESLNLLGSKLMKQQKFWILCLELVVENLKSFEQIIEAFNNAYNHLSQFDLITSFYTNTLKNYKNQQDIYKY